MYPLEPAQALKAALRGAKSLEEDMTVEEEIGFMLLADGIYCLQHLRDVYTERKK